MTTIRLPISRVEIESAATQIVRVAWRDVEVPTGREVQKVIDADRSRVKYFLRSISNLGAIARPELVTRAHVAMELCSDELQMFGANKLVSVLNRRQWVGGRS